MAKESPFNKIPSQLDQIPKEVPVVFISYSWDSETHQQWVKNLSKDLREKYRVYTLLDTYNRGGEEITTFMHKGLQRADRVLIIGTPMYKDKLENYKGGGVKFEDQVITISLYKEMDSKKFIPVLRDGSFTESFSELIETRLGYDMRNDGKYEERLQELAADIWGCPINIAPQLGPKPNFTPAAQTLQTIVPEQPQDFTTLIKSYILDPSKQILLIDLIETEAKKAYMAIMQNARYSHSQTVESFTAYIDQHQKAIENLMATVVPIVRYGNQSHYKLLIDSMMLLCKKPFINGEVTASGANYVHLLASTFLFNAFGVACIKYEKYQAIHEMMLAKVTAPNVFSPTQAYHLEYFAGCTHWDYNTLNIFLRASWIYPYSQLVMSSIKQSLIDIFFDDDDFINHYYTWEHFASLLCRYYKCCPLKQDWNPIGGFIQKRIALYRNEDDIYTEFFKSADKLQDKWEPLKQGLFNGKYSEYVSNFTASEDFYKRSMRY